VKKSETLAKWKALAENQNPLPLMRPIPYRTQGSRYGCCGIRIDGSPEFVDAVLSCLKALLPGENALTRLELARSTVKSDGVRQFLNGSGGEVCYIRLHERGGEAQVMESRYGSAAIRQATAEYAELLKAS